jgi:hypothetical protein
VSSSAANSRLKLKAGVQSGDLVVHKGRAPAGETKSNAGKGRKGMWCFTAAGPKSRKAGEVMVPGEKRDPTAKNEFISE